MPCRTREKNEKSIACLSRQRMEATILSQIETMDHDSQADEVFGPHNRLTVSYAVGQALLPFTEGRGTSELTSGSLLKASELSCQRFR